MLSCVLWEVRTRHQPEFLTIKSSKTKKKTKKTIAYEKLNLLLVIDLNDLLQES